MEEANLALSPMIDFLKAKQALINDATARKQVEKVIEIFEFEKNKFIYGQTMEAPKSGTSEFANRKLMKNFLSAVSWGRLAFDPIMQAGNLVSGNVQAFLAAEMKEANMGTPEDFWWAKRQMYGDGLFFYKLIEDYGKLTDINLETMILRFFNPNMKSMDHIVDVNSRGKMRRLLNRAFNIKDIAYVIQDKGEMEIALTTLLKNLSAYKFNLYETDASGKVVLDDQGNPKFKKDENGNIMQIKAYDALIKKGNTVGIREDVAMDMEDLTCIRNATHQEYLRHQGNYARYTKPKIESGMTGMLLNFFRKYLEPALEVRFKGSLGVGDPKNWIQGQAQLGWWTAIGSIFKYYGAAEGMRALFLPNFISDKLGNSAIDPYYKSKAFQARREAGRAILFTLMYVYYRSLIYNQGDDDSKQLTWGQMQAMRLMAKVANESRSLVPLPYFGKTKDYITNFSTYTSAFNEAKTLETAFENMGYYMAYPLFDPEGTMGQYIYERGFYQRKAGRFEAGEAKLLHDVTKLTGTENVQDLFDPSYQVKKQYQSKD
jgi:hypothetical protein